MLKWRSEQPAQDGYNRATIFSVGFSPPGLHTEFLRRAKIIATTQVGGFRIMDSCMTVLNAAPETGYRFFYPLPPGWTDEELIHAMIMQGGLDPDHILRFGADMQKGLKISAPSGDLFLNYAAAGCINHGSLDLVPITQPPSRMFVTHPVTGIECHIKARKVGACKDCWSAPGRHQAKCIYSGVCKMCLEKLEDLPQQGRRHACGQGFMHKPQEKRPFDYGEMPTEAPEPTTLAARIRAAQEANIQAAKAKRKRETEMTEDEAMGLTPAQAAQETQETAANKTSKTTGNDSPGGSSPVPTNNTASAPTQDTTPPTVSTGRRRNK
jgi:hypothetical protein